MHSDRSSTLRSASLIGGACLLVAIAGQDTGCSAPPEASPGSSTTDGTGTVGLTLTLPGGENVDTVTWTITGPNGASTVVQQGTVNLQNSETISFLAGGLPPGQGYGVTLSGTSTDGLVTCTGSATFSITARQTTNVTVLLQCATGAPDSGSALINGQPFNCATVTSVSETPAETTVGNSVSLAAAATAPNAAALSYAWSASSGSFSAPTSATTSFTCSAPGAVTVTVSVSDGTLPDGGSCNPALTQSSVQVQCAAALDGGSSADATLDGSGPSACNLGRGSSIQHVIYIQFDNTHLYRDADRAGNTNVPSDLEQMPALLNFIRGNGTMMANDHTQLISHTAGGMLTSLTGVYPDRHGQTVTNSYVRTSSTGAFTFPSSFAYWTDPAQSNTTIPNMVQPDGTMMPAPWVAYTRAGCNFGAVASANMVLENTGTGSSGDITKVFGIGSPQYAEAVESNGASSGTAEYAIAVTDFEGLAVHCANGSSVCAGGETDSLPQEPGGYTGYSALFGAKQINPVLTGASDAVTDMLGNPIADPFGQPGFPGFDGMTAAVSLGYVASMQEHGVPVTYAYISDAHDNHGVDGTGQTPYGPGAAGYVAQLEAYNEAFASFFARLAKDGINQTNTLFIFTVDEGDHFVGGAPTPTTCDGVTTPCAWASNQIGEIDINIDTLMTNEAPAVASAFLGAGAPDSFTVHGDDAPTFYLSRVSGTAGPLGALAQTDPETRIFERAAAALTVTNLFTGNTDSLLYQMADQTGMQALHMFTTGDPARNPVFAYFANDDYFVTDYPSSTCLDCLDTSYAWNHGDDQSIIGMTWLGFVGPGVVSQNSGPDQTIFTDHTDVRPTMNSILGLQDMYPSDGRVITEALLPTAYAGSLDANLSTTQSLGQSYKQINAPFAPFAQCVLSISTAALQGNDANDATYTSLESQIASLIAQRNTLASSIIGALNAAEFGGTPVSSSSATGWITQAEALLTSCETLQASLPVAGTGDAGTTGTGTGDAGASDAGAADTAAADAADAQVAETGAPDAGAPKLVVYRVGNGTATLSGAAAPVFLDELTFAGALVTSIAMPTTPGDGGTVNALVSSGTATSEGEITLSTDGHHVLLTGYNAAAGTSGIASTTSATVARVVGRVDAEGNVDTSTALNAFSGNNIRSVASPDGINLWIGGANSGALYTTAGSTGTAFTSLDTSTSNLRQLGIFGSQLYASSASGSLRLGAVGVGLPTTAPDGTTLPITNLPGFSTSTGDPYGFFFATLNGGSGPDTLYVADDTIGITKYTLGGGSWAASGTVGTSANEYRGLTGITSGTSVTLFATGNGATLVTIADSSGYGGTFSGTPTTLATPATNTAFRGVALAPQ